MTKKQLLQVEEICKHLLDERHISKVDKCVTESDWVKHYEWERHHYLRTNEARQMAIIYALRQADRGKQYWFVTFDQFVYRASVELANSGEAFYAFPCFMKPGRWLEILEDASIDTIGVNVFREILISNELGRVADAIESAVIAQMLENRVDKNIRDVKTLRFMFDDIVNRKAVQDAYDDVMQSQGIARLEATDKLKDEIIASLKDKVSELQEHIEKKDVETKKASIAAEKAEGKAKYLRRELRKSKAAPKAKGRRRKRS